MSSLMEAGIVSSDFPSAFGQVNDVYVYEVEGLLVPGTVALGLLYAPAPHKIKYLAPILRSMGPKGYTLVVPPIKP